MANWYTDAYNVNASPAEDIPELAGTHPSPIRFPLGLDTAGQNVEWNTADLPHLLVYGSTADQTDVLLANIARQAFNHERSWHLYSANAFGAGKHAHGLDETAWHNPVNVNLYMVMMTELWKLYNFRLKTMASYGAKDFSDLSRIRGTKRIMVLLPEVSLHNLNTTPEVKMMVEYMSLVALRGHTVGMHGVFVVDSMDDSYVYSDILNHTFAEVALLRDAPEEDMVRFRKPVTRITPHH